MAICHIRSIQAKVKYSILLLPHSLKSPTSGAPVSSEHTSEHSSQKQSTAQHQ